MRVIGGFVVALAARESSAAAWEAHPSMALPEVLARALFRQRLANFDAQLPLVLPGLLQLPPRTHALSLVCSNLPPLGKAISQDVCTFDSEILLGIAACAAGSLAVSRAEVVYDGLLCTLPTTGQEIAPEELDGMATHTQDVRNGCASTMTDRWCHAKPELLLANWARHFNELWVCTSACRLHIGGLLTPTAHDLQPELTWKQSSNTFQAHAQEAYLEAHSANLVGAPNMLLKCLRSFLLGNFG